MDIAYTKKFSTDLAIASFSIGTLLFLASILIQTNFEIYLVDFLYIVFAVIINGIMLLYLMIGFIRYPTERQEIGIRILLLLCNIPIAILYFFIIMRFFVKSSF